MTNGRLWTEEEKKVVVEMYPDHFASEIAERLGRSTSGIYRIAKIIGIESTKEKIARSGRMSSNHPNAVASRFKKGSVPPNKGKKMSPEVYEKVKHTMFRKGHMPINHKPVGSERINVDGYVEVKMAEPSKWRLKHRVIWEDANGKIPPGYNIQFKNGNTQDVRLDNLYIISRAEQMGKENSMHARYPEELKAVIRLKGSIKRQITEYKKKHGDGKEC